MGMDIRLAKSWKAKAALTALAASGAAVAVKEVDEAEAVGDAVRFLTPNADKDKPISDRPTARSLAERAGLNATNTDACPCFCGGTFSQGDSAICGMDEDAAETLAAQYT